MHSVCLRCYLSDIIHKIQFFNISQNNSKLHESYSLIWSSSFVRTVILHIETFTSTLNLHKLSSKPLNISHGTVLLEFFPFPPFSPYGHLKNYRTWQPNKYLGANRKDIDLLELNQRPLILDKAKVSDDFWKCMYMVERRK